jgi:hypothetical protein
MTDPKTSEHSWLPVAIRCTAKSKTTGRQCGRPIVPGATVCRYHGGAAPQVKAAAERRLADAAAVSALDRLGIEIDTTPEDALLKTIKVAAGMVVFYQWQVQQLDPSKVMSVTRIEDREGFQAGRAVTRESAPQFAEERLSHWLKVLADVSAVAIRTRIDERRVKIAEDQGALVAGMLRKVLARMLMTVLAAAPAARDVIEDAWSDAVGRVVPEELLAIEGTQS